MYIVLNLDDIENITVAKEEGPEALDRTALFHEVADAEEFGETFLSVYQVVEVEDI